MPSTNVARLGFGLQTAKGTASAAPQYWVDLTGGGMRPDPQIETRSETGLGRDAGDQYIRVLQAGGDPGVLLRPKTAALFYYGVLGSKSVTQLGTIWSSGQTYTQGQLIRPVAGGKLFEVTTPGTSGTTEPAFAGVSTIGNTINSTGGAAVYTLRQNSNMYEHLLTPANDQPYFTIWKELGDSIFEKFIDCKLTQCNVEFAGGGDLAASLAAFGLDILRLAATPGGGVYETGVEPIRVPGAVYTIGGSADNSLTSGNFNVEAAQTPIQTNQVTNSYLEPGARAITFGYEGVYTDVSRYAKVYYGGPAGTTPTRTIWEEAVELQFGPNYGPQVKYNLQRALFTEAAANPDPAANPLMLSVGGAAGRVAAGNIAEVRVRNDVASYVAA